MPLVISMLLTAPSMQALTEDVKQTLETAIKGAVILGAGTVGYEMKDMNDRYSKEGKRPDIKMRAYKTMGGLALIAALELFSNNNKPISTYQRALQIAAKLSSFGLSTLMISDPVAKFFRETPGIKSISGFLTDPVDKDGYEWHDFGAFARVALVWLPLREGSVAIVNHFFESQ